MWDNSWYSYSEMLLQLQIFHNINWHVNIVMNGKQVKIWKDDAVIHFKLQANFLSAETWENQEEPVTT